jgi:tetratricopeptide (TPR) repeat protein/serine/threonine protein kinase
MTASASLREPADSADVHLAELIDELTGRLQAGEPINLDACVRDHPEHAERLEKLLPALRLLADASRPGNARLVAGTIGDIPSPSCLGELGDFRLVREIGRGAMGIVYEAVQISLNRPVALKVMPFAATLDHKQLQRFKNEAQAAAQLHHTNIVPVYFVGCERGVHFYAMQYVEGRNLADVIAELRGQADNARTTPQPSPSPLMERTVDAGAGQPVEAVLPASGLRETGSIAAHDTARSMRDAAYFRKAAQLGIQAAEALDHAHQHAIVHRDIKPANLLLDTTDRLWVTDFGLAQVQCDTRLTMTGDLVGTLRYMSPEQALAKRIVVDHRTDVYSLGATLYELLTLEPAFTGRDRQELLRQIAFEEPRPPRRLNKAIPLELETIVAKAMEKNPADRYATAQELADDLHHFLKDEPIRAKRPTLMLRMRKWGRRHTAVVWSAAVCATLGSAMLAGSIAWTARDLAAHRAETERLIAGMLDESVLWQQKRQTPEALAAARRAAALPAGAAVDERLTKRVGARLADLELLDRLENIRLEQESAIKDDGFDLQGAEALYRQTFQAAGLDVEGVPPEEAAERIGKTTIAIELAAALDHWAWLRRRIKGDQDPGWKDLLRIAWTADQDDGRRRLRQALAGGDRQALVAAAAAEEVFRLPVPTLAVLGSSLVQAPDTRAQAEAFLRGAQRQYPNDFWLNCNLAAFLATTPPFQLEEAARFAEAAVALRPQCAAAHYNLGCDLRRLGKPDEAIAQYRQALRLHENHALAHNNLGNALLDTGLGEEAIAEYREALRLQRNSALFHNNLGNALLEQDQLEQAIAELHEAIRLNEHFSIPHANLGAALCEKGLFEEAIAECREAVRLETDSPLAHTNLGKVLKDQGLVDEAIAEFREAIRLKKDYAVAHSNLGAALRDKGLVDEAIAECREAIRLKKDYATAHNNLGVALARKGLVDEAITSYREAIRLKKNYAVAHNNLGAALREKGRRDEAIAEFRETIRLRKGFAIAHLNLGLALADKDLLDDAIAEFREAARLKPDFAEAHSNLGKALSLKGPEDEAIAELREAIRLKENDAEAHYNLGVALRKRGLLDQAITEFREAIRLKKDAAVPHNDLGNALREKGLPQEAIAEFREAIRLKKDYAEAHSNMGNALADKGLIDDAIAEYREAIRLQKDFAEARNNLGNALSHKGIVDDAIAELREAIRLKKDYAEAHNNLGVALRKNGQLDEAIAACRKAVHLKKDVATFHNNLGNALVDKDLVDEAIAAYREAIRLQKNFAPAYYNLGIALARTGRLSEAIAAYRDAIHFRNDHAEAHCNLGLVLMETEQFPEAVEELRIGHQLGSQRPGWPNPSEQWLRKAETLARLPALLKGEAKPAGTAERLLLADFCLRHKRGCAMAARWYGEAFAAQPELLANQSSGHRYNAACSAALAGCDAGKDVEKLDGAERGRLRGQALDWLRADLTAWGKVLLEDDIGKTRPVVIQRLEQWLKDADLAGVRGEGLAKLPETERRPWRDLWADVDKTLAGAREQTARERKDENKD